ncbi:MAG: choice-of-anchor L domain-containing protein [Pirellulales bacterium]
MSNAFSLGSYSNEDLPTLYFNYNLPLFTAGFSVYIQNSAGQRTQLANSLGLTTGAWTQSRLDLSKVTIAGQSVAGQDGLRLVFAYDAAAGAGGGVSIDDVVIGFAERGEQIIGAAAGSAFTAVAVPNGTITSGEYQLEIRTGEDFFTSSATGLTLTKTFDTNDRAAPQLTIVAPEGRAVSDGDTFYLQVDGQRVTFEFSTDGVVTPGNVALNITGTEADYEIARKIRDAVNDPSVQSRVKVKAAFSSGLESGTAGKDNRVNLFGNVTGNFQTYSTKTMSITSVTNNANTLRNQIFGTGITATTPAVYTGGNQSAAIVNLGSDTGILLSTGNVNSLTAPNTNDNASGISSNAGNPDINAALGITSTDSTSLEMKFQFGDGTVGGDLFMDLMFASEEYNEAVSRDRLVVLVDGVNIALVPSTASPINSATVNRNTNSKYFYNNDPSDGGKYLYQNGFDGFTSLFTLSKLGLASGEHTLKVIIADTVTTGTDSAVFIRTGSVSSSARVQNSAPIQAIFFNGTSDQNTNRDQGQVLIQNNYIRDARDYAVWSEPGTRQNDPRDLIANRAPGFTGVMQNIPGIGSGSLGAVRNLLELNNTIPGGFSPGIVVSNNVMEHGGLGGVNVAGELPIFMITPSFIPGPGTTQPSGDHSIGSNTNPFDHFGSFLDDGDILVVDGGRNRVRFEFEDIAGAGVGSPTFGSGQVQGNGYADTSVPVYYREDGGQQYLRLPTSPNNPGYSALETLEGLRDSILGSILVTNGTTQHITATIAPALLAPDTTALPSGATPGYPNYYNKPALYLEGATAITFINAQGGGNPFNIRRVDAAASTQPFARIVNNTIIGNDGRESFAATSTVNEPNDTIATAVDTWQGTAHNPQTFTLNASIGDSSQFRAAPSQDVDLYKFKLDIGEPRHRRY